MSYTLSKINEAREELLQVNGMMAAVSASRSGLTKHVLRLWIAKLRKAADTLEEFL